MSIRSLYSCLSHLSGNIPPVLYLSIYICLSTYLSIYVSIHGSVCLPACLPARRSVGRSDANGGCRVPVVRCYYVGVGIGVHCFSIVVTKEHPPSTTLRSPKLMPPVENHSKTQSKTTKKGTHSFRALDSDRLLFGSGRSSFGVQFRHSGRQHGHCPETPPRNSAPKLTSKTMKLAPSNAPQPFAQLPRGSPVTRKFMPTGRVFCARL